MENSGTECSDVAWKVFHQKYLAFGLNDAAADTRQSGQLLLAIGPLQLMTSHCSLSDIARLSIHQGGCIDNACPMRPRHVGSAALCLCG